MPDAFTAAEARGARASTAAVFFLTGAGFANWVVRIPAVQDRLGLGTGALGAALLGVAAGALVAMPLAGRLVARLGSRPVTRASALLFAAALALPAIARSLPWLTLALVALGAANGALGVAMNAQAVAVERRYGRPIMSSFHALFSLGGLAGAAAGGAAAAARVAPEVHLGVVALLVGIGMAGVASGMLPAGADATPGDAPAAPRARPTRALAPLGIVAFCVLFGEGAMADWSAVYLRDAAGAGPGLAAAGFAAFSLAMAAARAVGDGLTLRVGAVGMVRAGGAVAALGLVVALLGGHPLFGVAGFGLVGAGLATVFPSVVGAAARLPGSPGAAIAAVSTCGYAGFLAGPPVIGLAAEAWTLRGALALVVAAALVIVGLAPGLDRRAVARRAVERRRAQLEATRSAA